MLRGAENKPILYFEGNRDSFVGITSRPIFYKGNPAAIRLFVEQNDDFSYRLWYQERSLADMPLTALDSDFDYQESLLLLDGVGQVELSYFGAKDLNAYTSHLPFTWWQSFNSLNRGILPELIRISYSGHQGTDNFVFPLAGTDLRSRRLFDDTPQI
ncbi:hypothetical protein GCM10009092_17770 [Bowmanella denitrificans]|uniref:Uncharacterized protein n=2 Tax=Bowmanella denitrificans TaxID=366582 RepID=A0ABN0X349_9ALTE